MSELINREDVQREIQSSFNLGAFRWQDGQDLMDRINALPTIEAVRHGEWERAFMDNPNADIYYCSECRSWEHGRYPYCHCCGARMDGKRREG